MPVNGTVFTISGNVKLEGERRALLTWADDRNSKVVKVERRFSTADTRINLKRLDPKIHD